MLSGGSVVLGLAAIATGNNLLFLLLGAVLGFIVLSGWLSEQTVRRLGIVRRVPRGVVAGFPASMAYEISNGKRRIPSFAFEVGEAGGSATGFVPALPAGEHIRVRAEMTWESRGVYPLEAVSISTSFPFGLFRKERWVPLPGEVVVWPRSDRVVPEPRTGGERVHRGGHALAGAAGARGEYRGLRPYRPGDDPRDVHWRSTARMNEPVVREFERDRAEILWVCLDLRVPPGHAAEEAAELAASVAASALRQGRPVGLAAGTTRISPVSGAAQRDRLLDALARCTFAADAPLTPAPGSPAACVLVTAGEGAAAGWGDVLRANSAAAT